MGKSKLPGILIDHDFFVKPRNRAFISRHGSDGVVALLTVWCALAQESSWFLDESMMKPEMVCLPIEMSRDKFAEIIGDAIAVGLLEKAADGRVFNSRILADGENYRVKADSYKAAWEKRRRKKSKRNHDETIDESIMDSIVYVDVDGSSTEGSAEGRKRRPRKPPKDKREIRPGVWLTDGESAEFVAAHGKEFMARCADKLQAWIEQDPTPKRKKNGFNAGATFRSWVINAIAQEQASTARVNGHPAKPDPNANRPQPQLFKPPEPRSERTPEERARIKALIAEKLPKVRGIS